MTRAVRFGLALLLAYAPLARAADDLTAGRPAFSPAEQPPERTGRCEEIRGMSAGLPEHLDDRIDLAVQGTLTTVRGDGALWYLLMCTDVRIMCVTYESNDMKAGDTVIIRGGYRRLDRNHAVLDPCLANRPEQDGEAAK